MQDQLICRGCRNRLMYRRGATDVCCSLCNTINSVHSYHPHPIPPQGMDMAHIRCGGCQTMLMYTRGDARSVRCSCCQTLNNVSVPTAAPPSNQTPHVSNQTAHINCGHCRTTLMYPYGAPSVKCAVCQYITNVNMSNGRVPQSMNRPNGTVPPPTMPSTSTTQTVVVENPMSMDESGKLVSNVVVGVTTAKK